jgi:phosphodiesterase/alkaline phosphatase D-like protein
MFVNRIVVTIVTPLLAGLAALIFSVAPALAVAPETPETVSPATGITAKTATLHGALDPGNAGEAGSYDFSYEPSSSLAPECGAPGTLAPSFPVAAAGAKGEAKEVTLTGLEPNKEYAFCIVAYSLLAEPSYGTAKPFKTLGLAPEYVAGSEHAAGVSATGATLEATLNPNNEEASYSFEYSTEGKTGAGEKLEGTIVKVSGVLPAELGERTASASTGVLKPDTTYYYRVVAENEKSKEEGKPVEGAVASFTTAPETPETLSPAKSVTATTAVLEGVLNPKATVAVKAGWYFDYNLGTSCTGGSTTAAEAEATVKAMTESNEVEDLQPDAKYTFCLVATNATGAQSTLGNEVSLMTSPAPPTIESGSETTSGVTPYEATLEAQVNPNNQATTYSFEYSTSNTLAGATMLKGKKALSGYGDQTASATTGHVLTPGTTYYYRVVTENASHEKTEGKIEHFTASTTVAPVIENETSSVQSPFAATLEATVNPDYQLTTCAFEYGTDPSLATDTTTVACSKSLGEGGPGTSTSVALTGLKSATTYYFRIVATNASGTTTDTTIEKLETPIAEAPVVEGESVSMVTAFTAELRGKVIPSFQATTCEFQYGTDSSLVTHTTVPCDPGQFGPTSKAEDTGVSLTGLQQDTPYYYRVVATNATGTTTDPTIETFTTLIAPAVTPGEAQDVTRATVMFSGGTVNPEGAETRYRVAYVPASEYAAGATNPYANGRSTTELNAGSGSTPQPVTSTDISELSPGTVYDYAIIATNSGGTIIGPDQTFTTSSSTPPIAITDAAIEVSQFSGTITGSVDTRELSATEQFEFGTTPGTRALIPAAIISVQGPTVNISATVNDLQPDTTYYYRTVATNADGTEYGAEQSFTTPGNPTALTSTPTPAFIPYTPITTLDTTEAHENKTTGTAKKARKTKKPKKKNKHTKHKKHNQKTKKAGLSG